MPPVIRKIFGGFLLLLLIVVATGAIYVASRQHLRFNPPEPAISASADTAVIARGRYVVRTMAGCADCHGAPDQRDAYTAGADVPLSGGFVFKIPPGDIHVRNITPDRETGIGAFSDGAIARALRLGVGGDGRALLPFMEMQGLSDEDLQAVVSYLRTQAPVHNAVPDHRFNILGMIVRATALANPAGPKSEPPHRSPHGPTVENGKYLAGSVANCWSCHTQRDPNTGGMTGPLYGGATGFVDDYNPKRTWNPPNLTAAPKTGRAALFTEDQFVARFRSGRLIAGSPMPWQAFSKMSEDDIRAIYRFLKTLPPEERDVGAPFVAKP